MSRFCVWCSDPEDVTETLEISPTINWLLVKDAFTERAVELDRNSDFVDEYEVRKFGSDDVEVVGHTVNRRAVLTLQEIHDVIQGLEADSLIRSSTRQPICKRCASSIMDLD